MKKDRQKLSNANVPMIVPLVLLAIIVGLVFALVNKEPNTIFNISSDNNNYETNIGTIKYEKESYTCEEGETFETIITASNPKNGKDVSTVKSYGTSDSNVATIDDEVSSQVNCVNCRNVRVVCKKAGRILLNAKSSLGATTTSELIVRQKEGTISFEKTNYTCNAGETFETMIKTTNGLTIASYNTSNNYIASIDDKTSVQVNCVNCRMVRVVCKKAGNVTLSAKASNGTTTLSNLTVNEDIGTISFKENSYTCNAGETFETLITAKGGPIGTSVKSYTTSNTDIATIDDKTSVQVNCINCRMVRVVCKKAGSVSLNAESSSGAKTSVNLTIKNDIGTISFEKKNYSCEAGSTFETLITAKGGKLGTYVKSYTTSDTNIATIDDKTSVQPNCTNCRMVRVVCKKKGNVTLNATSSSGAKTSSSLTVNENVGTISFEKTSYTCNAGETFETLITAKGGKLGTYVKSYTTSDTNIATVDDKTTVQVKCVNCRMVRVVCKKAGNVTLKAESSSGAKTSVSLKVNENIGTISFDKSSYTCKEGATFETLITAKGGPLGTYVKSYTTSNTNIATIDDKTSVQVNCINCRMVRVVCKNAGSVVLRAESSSGAKTTSSLTVEKDVVGTISYAKPDYECTAGKTFETIITAYNSDGSARVSTYGSSNTAVASVDDNVTAIPKCINCKAVRVVCKKKGTISLRATSNKGAVTISNLTVK